MQIRLHYRHTVRNFGGVSKLQHGTLHRFGAVKGRKYDIVARSRLGFEIGPGIEHRVLRYEESDVLAVDAVSFDEGEFLLFFRVVYTEIVEKFLGFELLIHRYGVVGIQSDGIMNRASSLS